MSGRTDTSEAGFTLIEVLVAALVIVIVLTALAVIFITGQNQASAQVEQTQIINLADQQLEQIRSLVRSSASGFDALALSATPTLQSSAMIDGTFQDPTNFVFNTSPACFEIDNNYDNLVETSTRPYASQPEGFTEWSDCGSYGEPLEEIPSGALVTELSTPSAACALGAGTEPSTVNSPCLATLGASEFMIYTFVTDTYVGCGNGSMLSSNTITTAATSPAYSCPSVANGVLSASSCVNGSGTGTFGTDAQTSSPCADARRVTVVVVPVSGHVHTQLARLTPVYLSSIFTNPSPTSASDSGAVGIILGGGS
ncbi:type II secretion system protein [Conexibacter sp. DBS9H8]|uniref:type II secretion system protein n=1 Tax=Conexibacter sp. DBS9H8 TaxID=2937801 RepID=UPI00211387EE|nr:type II secretion system protein [Conexibacter sp. DBS9H8]